ncbi:aminoglycoside phosphotransferase family protein [Flavobacterium humi]|uniref:Aminoglycoside phosphotransferase family protein n=1 Tax=Flavobacterium humi TaxID=2562683 RepID=A0A4Z0L9Q9_9FLAO|nr:aminoglycoside phosphotransferase family protein [Flavobacterium humi]TGD59205.1 aminoglycoside phosphotransferase family protein [Flavobacterium humi]
MASNATSEIKAYLSGVGLKNIEHLEVRRGRNLIATFAHNSKWLILKKKGSANTVFNGTSLGNELAFLDKSAKSKEVKAMSFLPKTFHFNYAEDILISRYYKGYTSLMQAKPEAALFQSVGKQLGKLHSINNLAFKESLPKINRGDLLPEFNYFTPQAITSGGPSVMEYIRFLQKFPDLLAAIDELYAKYEENCIVHGDFKADNVLVYRKKGKQYCKIIDYEFTAVGDRHYDLGYILGSFLMKWVYEMKLTHDTMDFADNYFQELRKAFLVLMESYQKETGSVIDTNRIVRFAGLYLMKIFFNCSIHSRHLSKNELMLLQIARNYLVFSDKQTSIHFL